MSALDYIGRRFDLLALQGQTLLREALLKQQLFNGNSGQICTGVQKMAQRWVLEFCTPTGSMRFEPTRGVDFVQHARTGRLRNEIDVIAEYNFAAMRIKQNMANEEVPEMEDDERLDTDELLGIALSADLLVLNIRLTSKAGTSREPILPIPLLPIKIGA
jgi:hypothetical protein